MCWHSIKKFKVRENAFNLSFIPFFSNISTANVFSASLVKSGFVSFEYIPTLHISILSTSKTL